MHYLAAEECASLQLPLGFLTKKNQKNQKESGGYVAFDCVTFDEREGKFDVGDSARRICWSRIGRKGGGAGSRSTIKVDEQETNNI